MKPPIHKMKVTEIRYLASHLCEHGHTYLEHFGCYEPKETKLGFLDIEASNLDADFGIMLSYCIKEHGKDGKTYYNVLNPADIKKAKAGDEDKHLVQQCVADMLKFDQIVGYYSTRFDIPYIRTRALMCGVKFPFYGSIKHIDLYYMLRHRFKLSSNRLENACRCIIGKTEKTRIENRFWRGGVRGDKHSLAYILDHNIKDVTDLEKLYDKVIDYSRRIDRSI